MPRTDVLNLDLSNVSWPWPVVIPKAGLPLLLPVGFDGQGLLQIIGGLVIGTAWYKLNWRRDPGYGQEISLFRGAALHSARGRGTGYRVCRILYRLYRIWTSTFS
jgi:hypothetical protein